MNIVCGLAKEWKQDCAHIVHNQSDPLPFIIIYSNTVLVLNLRVPMQPKQTSITILVCMTSKGKGCLTGGGLHEWQSCFHSLSFF